MSRLTGPEKVEPQDLTGFPLPFHRLTNGPQIRYRAPDFVLERIRPRSGRARCHSIQFLRRLAHPRLPHQRSREPGPSRRQSRYWSSLPTPGRPRSGANHTPVAIDTPPDVGPLSVVPASSATPGLAD